MGIVISDNVLPEDIPANMTEAEKDTRKLNLIIATLGKTPLTEKAVFEHLVALGAFDRNPIGSLRFWLFKTFGYPHSRYAKYWLVVEGENNKREKLYKFKEKPVGLMGASNPDGW